MTRRAIVLLSGGIDSTTALAVARGEGYEVHAMSFRYGQRHGVEVKAAAEIARRFGVSSHKVVDIDLGALGGSALTADVAVPTDRTPEEMNSGIPATYVPARNTVFLSLAVAWAETLGASDIFIGVNSLDYSGYPDCRPEYIEAFERMANLGTKAGVEGRAFKVHAPLIAMTKAEIIRRGAGLGVDYSPTVSCYRADREGRACGRCDACILRFNGFREAGITDRTRYQNTEVTP